MSSTLAEIVIQKPTSVDVMNRFNLNYYCNGTESFFEACKRQCLDPTAICKLIDELPEHQSSGIEKLDAGLLSMILLNHYADFQPQIRQIDELLKMASANCMDHDRIAMGKLDQAFALLSSEILQHSLYEEKVLRLASPNLHQHDKDTGCCQPFTNTSDLHELVVQHMRIGNFIQQLRELTLSYSMKKFNSPFSDVIGILLHQFDKDVTQRLHIENNLLFPKILP